MDFNMMMTEQMTTTREDGDQEGGGTPHLPRKKPNLSSGRAQWAIILVLLALQIMDHNQKSSTTWFTSSSSPKVMVDCQNSRHFNTSHDDSEQNITITSHNISNLSSQSIDSIEEAIMTESKPQLPQRKSIEKIPFYLYPLEDFPAFWGPEGHCDHSKPRTAKHDHADFAWQAMMRHPWRTKYPEDAQLAILPLSLDLWARQGCQGISMQRVLNETKQVLTKSPIFPAVRHLIIANDFLTKQTKKTAPIMQLLQPSGILVGMEGRRDCETSLGYTSNYAEFMSSRVPNHVEMPTPPVFGAERKYSVHMVGQVDGRPAYRDRLVLFQSRGFIPSPYIVTEYKENNEKHKTMRHCNKTVAGSDGDFDRCLMKGQGGRKVTQQSQELSNYTLSLRGDTLGSDRWVNAMAAGTALIQVTDNEDQALSWLPFPHAVPWKDIVITIPRKAFWEDPAKSIRQVVKTTSEERLLELQRLSLHYVADLDWMAHNSRVLENLVYEAYTVPCASFDNRKHDK